MREYLLKIWQFITNYIGGNVLLPNQLRFYLYKILGIKTNTKRFNSNIWFYSSNIVIDEGVFVNNKVFFHNYDKIILEKNVFIGPEVILTTVNHEIGQSKCRASSLKSAPIIIKTGTWIGARVIVLPGVIIGEGCVIAAGAVVTKNCDPNGLYAGVSAKRIKNLI